MLNRSQIIMKGEFFFNFAHCPCDEFMIQLFQAFHTFPKGAYSAVLFNCLTHIFKVTYSRQYFIFPCGSLMILLRLLLYFSFYGHFPPAFRITWCDRITKQFVLKCVRNLVKSNVNMMCRNNLYPAARLFLYNIQHLVEQ